MELHQNQSGLVKLDKYSYLEHCCHDPQHNPPSHLYIPPGHAYKHTCLTCGSTVYLQPDVITC